MTKKNKNIFNFKKSLNLYLNEKKNKENLKLMKISFKNIKNNFLDKKEYHLILKNFEKNPKILKAKIKAFSHLGKILAQDKHGKKILEVKANTQLITKKGSIKKNLRYHQTNTGGSMHSDGPQLENPPNYVLMNCIKQANKGGYSIIIYADRIYKYLKKNKPKQLNILKKNFIFERRGFNFKNKNIFKKPVFEIKKNKFRFRYLREYMEKGYILNKIKLKSEQIKSLDLLDTLLKKKRFQKRYKLQDGDMILWNNNILAHGRTGFILNKRKQRLLTRTWLR